jgi:hypothetical protein
VAPSRLAGRSEPRRSLAHQLVCLEDGITSCGFRKLAAYAERLHRGTESHYVSTRSYRTVRAAVSGKMGTLSTLLDRDQVEEVAQGLRHADLLGFSSMTGYAALTRSVIQRVRELNPSAYIVWGGIHPIIEPEDAITADVDAICTGEGEFAFEQLFDGLKGGRDVTGTRNFWFKTRDGGVIKNPFLPLQTAEEMETLPLPAVRRRLRADLPEGLGLRAGHGRRLSAQRRARLPSALVDRLPAPLQLLRQHEVHRATTPPTGRLRHPSAATSSTRSRTRSGAIPHVSQVSFPRRQLHGDPLRGARRVRGAVARRGATAVLRVRVIPTYVKRDKFELSDLGRMNRIRMGIQSGSKAILDFYKRPTPPEKITARRRHRGFVSRRNITSRRTTTSSWTTRSRLVEDVVATLELALSPVPVLLAVRLLAEGDPEHRTRRGAEAARHRPRRDIDASSPDRSAARRPTMLLYLLVLWRPTALALGSPARPQCALELRPPAALPRAAGCC